MNVIYDAFISSHGSFPHKSSKGYSFNLPKNVELTFIVPRGFYGYCNKIKDKEIITALRTKSGIESYTKNKHTIRGGEECPNLEISFEPNKNHVWGVWRHKRSQPSQKPTFVLGDIPNKLSLMNTRRVSNRKKQPTMINQAVPILKVANVKEEFIDLSVILDILIAQIDNIEKKQYTLKIIISCCLVLPTTNNGYTPQELVEIHKFMASTISGSSINDYHNYLGKKPFTTITHEDNSGKKKTNRVPDEYFTHAPFYLSQLGDKSPALKNMVSGFGPGDFTVDGFGRTIPNPPTEMGKSYTKIKRRRLINNVKHTRKHLRSLKSTAKKSNHPKKVNIKRLTEKAVMKWMKRTLNKRPDKSVKNKTNNIKLLFN